MNCERTSDKVTLFFRRRVNSELHDVKTQEIVVFKATSMRMAYKDSSLV